MRCRRRRHRCAALAIVAIVVTPWHWPLVSHRRGLRRASEDTLSPLGRCRRVVFVSPPICVVSFSSALCWCGRVDAPSSSSCRCGTGRLCHVVVVVVPVSHHWRLRPIEGTNVDVDVSSSE